MQRRFSISAAMVILLCASVMCAIAGYLVRAALGDLEELFWFLPTVYIAPMMVMILACWAFRLARVFQKYLR